MNNNDILIRLRYALDIKNKDMIKIFSLGGIELAKEDLFKVLTRPKDEHELEQEELEAHDQHEEQIEAQDDLIRCSNGMLESFLNGFIVFKRGAHESKPENTDQSICLIKDNGNANNVVLKKLKIALELSSEDVIDILQLADVSLSKSQLGALLRKEGHKNYRPCGDQILRNFLKGLALKYR